MIDTLVTGVLIILAVLVGVLAFQRWRRKKNLWFILAIVAAVLAAVVFWSSWTNGFPLLLVAAVLLFIGMRIKKG